MPLPPPLGERPSRWSPDPFNHHFLLAGTKPPLIGWKRTSIFLLGFIQCQKAFRAGARVLGMQRQRPGRAASPQRFPGALRQHRGGPTPKTWCLYPIPINPALTAPAWEGKPSRLPGQSGGPPLRPLITRFGDRPRGGCPRGGVPTGVWVLTSPPSPRYRGGLPKGIAGSSWGGAGVVGAAWGGGTIREVSRMGPGMGWEGGAQCGPLLPGMETAP